MAASADKVTLGKLLEDELLFATVALAEVEHLATTNVVKVHCNRWEFATAISAGFVLDLVYPYEILLSLGAVVLFVVSLLFGQHQGTPQCVQLSGR